jgi:type IV pilus assembly protein PilV
MAGFTLLEVLVALVVLSIGLLGLSGLQTTSLRNNHAAFLRSQATLLNNDIADRMRANRDSATAGNYNIDYAGTPTVVSCVGSCSAVQVAQIDVAEWRAYVERLPGGESEINVDADGVAEIKVRWADARDSANKLQLVSRMQL